MNTEKTQLTRVNINLPTSLVEKVKDYALQLGVTTTSAYIFLLNQALNQMQTVQNFSMLSDIVNRIEELEKNN